MQLAVTRKRLAAEQADSYLRRGEAPGVVPGASPFETAMTLVCNEQQGAG
jgi:hypothetical protein